MIRVLLYLLLPLFIPSTATGVEDTQDICTEYLHERTEAGPGPEPEGSIPYGTGLLWKIGYESGTSVHLFGTIHSQDRLVITLPPAVRLALAQSRRLVLEVVPGAEADRVFAEALYFGDGTELEALLDRSVYRRLKEMIAGYGIPEENVDRLKPWAAFTLIGRPRPVNAPTQESMLMQAALAANKTIRGLESMEELVAALEGICRDDQIEILNDTVCNHASLIRNSRDLVEHYARRDLAGIAAFSQGPHHDEAVFDRFMQRMLHDRNDRMLARIEYYLREGGAFIAVGALHLPGERGLLLALERRGHAITPVY